MVCRLGQVSFEKRDFDLKEPPGQIKVKLNKQNNLLCFRLSPTSPYLLGLLLLLVILFLLLAFRHQVIQPAQLSLSEEEIQKLPDEHQRQHLRYRGKLLYKIKINNLAHF